MKKKVLLMGKSGSGKTSMRSIIFANYLARDTRRLGYTIDVEHSHVRFLGNLVLNLWDCGGQEAFMENYFSTQRDHIFRNVELLIYVFDVESNDIDKDMHYYKLCLEALDVYSKEAKIFCLVHKMDLIHSEMKAEILNEKTQLITNMSPNLSTKVTVMGTSIWDETLYKAWSSIVYTLVPNVGQLESFLNTFCEICGADEVILFERTTFLMISHHVTHPSSDPHRFEKVSNIIKQFKLSCSKISAQFTCITLETATFNMFFDVLTPTIFVMVLVGDKRILPALTLKNIERAKHAHRIQ